MVFTVEREKWDRSITNQNSKEVLLTTDGKMCCLGFVCIQLGLYLDSEKKYCYPYEVIKDINEPDRSNLNPVIKSFYCQKLKSLTNNELSTQAGILNDYPHPTDKDKEQALKELFQSYGYDINFV